MRHRLLDVSGVQGQRAFYVVRRLGEFTVVAPFVILTLVYLVVMRRRIAMVGRASPVISMFIAPLEAHLRLMTPTARRRWIVLNMSETDNEFVATLYGREVRILGHRSRVRRRLVWWAGQLSGRIVELRESKSDIAWASATQVVHLRDSELRRAHRTLEALGIDLDGGYFCVACRHAGYYRRLQRQGVVVKGRDVRNPSEEVYLSSAAEIAQQTGLCAVRLGRDLAPLEDRWIQRGIIDYAGTSRTDLLDVVLASRTAFLLNGATGAFWLTSMFHRPQMNGDVYDARHIQIDGSVFTLQRVWSSELGRRLTLREMLVLESRYADERYQGRLGVELLRNSPRDLIDATLELTQIIAGAWEPSSEAAALQVRYRKIVERWSSEPTWIGRGVISTDFLQRNLDLLE